MNKSYSNKQIIMFWFKKTEYRWTSLSAVFVSANLLICECQISLKGQISSQNVSFYLQIQDSQPKIAGHIYHT